MQDYQPVSRQEIERGLSPEHVKIMRLISLALIAGPLIFLSMILYFYAQSAVSERPTMDFEFITTYIYVIIFITIISYTAVFVIFPKRFLKPESIKKKMTGFTLLHRDKTQDDKTIRLIIFDRVFMIFRLAPLEVVSLFGMMALFLSVTNGLLHEHAELWLLILPWLFQTYFTLAQYISKDKMIDRLEYYNQILS